MNYGIYYEEMINLEGLDRQLQSDIQRLAKVSDKDGVELAQLARREVQNIMLEITFIQEARQ